MMCGHAHAVEWDVRKADEGFQYVSVLICLPRSSLTDIVRLFYAKTNWVLDLAGAGASNGTKVSSKAMHMKHMFS